MSRAEERRRGGEVRAQAKDILQADNDNGPDEENNASWGAKKNGVLRIVTDFQCGCAGNERRPLMWQGLPGVLF